MENLVIAEWSEVNNLGSHLGVCIYLLSSFGNLIWIYACAMMSCVLAAFMCLCKAFLRIRMSSNNNGKETDLENIYSIVCNVLHTHQMWVSPDRGEDIAPVSGGHGHPRPF